MLSEYAQFILLGLKVHILENIWFVVAVLISLKVTYRFSIHLRCYYTYTICLRMYIFSTLFFVTMFTSLVTLNSTYLMTQLAVMEAYKCTCILKAYVFIYYTSFVGFTESYMLMQEQDGFIYVSMTNQWGHYTDI